MRAEIPVADREYGVVETPACRHHWIIDSPQGATSMGVCKICGTRREFFNYAPEGSWDSESLSDLSSKKSWEPKTASAADEEYDLASSSRSSRDVIMAL